MWRTPRCYSANAGPQLEPSVVFVGDMIQSRDTVFATGIPNTFTEPEQIAKIFSRAGNIRRGFRGKGLAIKMYYNGRNGSFNGRARITYNTDKEAFLACHLLDQQRHGENVLEVKMALNHFHNQRNKPDLEKSDWTCHLCDKRGLTRVNYVWQKTCYNCQNDKTFCDTYGQTARESALQNKPKRTDQTIAKLPSKKKAFDINKGEQNPEENPPSLNPFSRLKVELKEEVDREEIPRPEVTTDSGLHSSSSDDSSVSSGESAGTEDNAPQVIDKEKLFEPRVENLDCLPEPVRTVAPKPISPKPEIDKISSSETETSMDLEEIHSPEDHPKHTRIKLENEEESSVQYFEHSEHFEHDHVPDNECDNLDTNRLKNELELELEASLLETFKKYKIFRNNLPLNIKIDVSRAVKSNSLERLSFNNEKLNVDLSLDDSLGIHKADIRGEGQNVKMEDIILENVTDEDVQVMDAHKASPSELPQTSGVKVLNKYFESTSSDESESENENFDQPGAMFIPMHSYAQGSGDKTHGEDDKSRRKFTLDQDKVILDKVIDIIVPGQRLDFLELVAGSSACKEVARRLSRTETSIQGRWKYNLRLWLLEYFQKKTKSWTGFTVKASIERRRAVACYFVKEL